jgi:hypothetical protein
LFIFEIMNRHSIKLKFLFFILIIGGYYLFRHVVKMQVIEYKAEKKITKTLEKSYPNYTHGTFWTLSSENIGDHNPPYFIHHIYSENGKDFKLVKHIISEDLNIISSKEESIHSFKSLDFQKDSLNKEIIKSYLIEVAKTDYANNKPYEAILILQEAIKIDSSSFELRDLRDKFLFELK